MSAEDDRKTAAEKWLSASLEKVQASITRWKAGECTVFDAHKEAVRHTIESQPITVEVSEAKMPPTKKMVTEHLLGEGPILIHCDARRPGVVVPEAFRSQLNLALRFGYRLTPPIPDLVIDESGISATLTFSGVPFHTTLPWSAIYVVAIAGEDRGMMWPEDVPADLDEAKKPSTSPRPADTSKRTSHLKLV